MLEQALKKQTVGLDQLEAGINEHREGVAIANMKLKDAAAKVSVAEHWQRPTGHSDDICFVGSVVVCMPC